MWKKVQMSRLREPKTGAPILVDTTLDRAVFQPISGNPVARDQNAGHEDLSKDLPALPVEAEDPNAPHPGRRVPSSIYSSDHPDSSAFIPQQTPSVRINAGYSEYAAPDISPPDSPIEFDGTHRQDSPDISPISDTHKQTFPLTQKKTRFDSQLPVLRKDTQLSTPSRQKAAGSSSALQSSPGQGKTKWDNVSEPTTTDSEKTSRVIPIDSPYQRQVESRTSAKQGSGLLGVGKEKFQAGRIFLKGRDQDSKDKKDSKQPREPWKGASGRSPLVNPIESKPGARKFTQRARRDAAQQPSPSDLSFSRGYTITTITTGNDSDRQPAKKRTEDKKNTRTPQSSAAQMSSQEAIVNPSSVGTSGGIFGNLNNARTNPAPESRSNESTLPRLDPVETDLASDFQDLGISNEPGSRFSATTYATTEAGPSPPGSSGADADADAPPVPTVPTSIMDRKRPIPSANAWAKSTTRKPTPSATATPDGDTSKALPQSPPEVQAQNRIETLEARQKELAVRKANINTIIYELTQVIQPSSIAYDMATRDEVKRTVTSLNNELADIKKEEHEIGLKLLRAWKKRDQLDDYEATTLWVKRVTS
ncbi:hypothetical protein VTN77DRAFT_5765 [Rasamsonia byssochlamydoides]|uniref:uncharacterized protein n=1 Tax=Rasamsonia byssochlamydoides TaxID=89139 RepID=UPI0037443BD6